MKSLHTLELLKVYLEIHCANTAKNVYKNESTQEIVILKKINTLIDEH